MYIERTYDGMQHLWWFAVAFLATRSAWG